MLLLGGANTIFKSVDVCIGMDMLYFRYICNVNVFSIKPACRLGKSV